MEGIKDEKPKCPKCNAIGECFYRQVGHDDKYEDEYILYCKECGHIEKKQEHGGSVLGENWFTKCPFCGKESKERENHKYPSDELLSLANTL